jgi:hypothetical protein
MPFNKALAEAYAGEGSKVDAQANGEIVIQQKDNPHAIRASVAHNGTGPTGEDSVTVVVKDPKGEGFVAYKQTIDKNAAKDHTYVYVADGKKFPLTVTATSSGGYTAQYERDRVTRSIPEADMGVIMADINKGRKVALGSGLGSEKDNTVTFKAERKSQADLAETALKTEQEKNATCVADITKTTSKGDATFKNVKLKGADCIQ